MKLMTDTKYFPATIDRPGRFEAFIPKEGMELFRNCETLYMNWLRAQAAHDGTDQAATASVLDQVTSEPYLTQQALQATLRLLVKLCPIGVTQPNVDVNSLYLVDYQRDYIGDKAMFKLRADGGYGTVRDFFLIAS